MQTPDAVVIVPRFLGFASFGGFTLAQEHPDLVIRSGETTCRPYLPR